MWQLYSAFFLTVAIANYMVTLSTHRLLDINVTKNVHPTLQQVDLARNFKKWKEQIYT
jgi:hypothetical protein